MEGNYAKKLSAVFDALGFTEPERQTASEGIKKKFFAELLTSLEERMSQADKDWIKSNIHAHTINNDAVGQVRQRIQNLYSHEEITTKSHEVFDNLLARYVKFMSSRVGSETAKKLEGL